MRRHILVGALAGLLASWSGELVAQAPQSDSMTVEQAVRLALASHPALWQAAEGISASAARVEQSRSDYYPVIAAGGSVDRTAPVPSLELPAGQVFTLIPRNRYVAAVSVHQTVLDFGRRATALELSRTRGASATTGLALLESGVAFRTIDDFYAVLFLRQSLRVQDEQIEALNQHLAAIRERARSGAATDFDVLTTQVRVATAQSRRIDVANELDRRMIELRQLLGWPDDQALLLKGEFRLVPIGLAEDSLSAAALGARPEMQLAHEAEASAEVDRRLAGLGDRPSFNLDVRAGFQNGYQPNLDRIKGNWDAGVSVRVPVFDGRRTRGRVDETEAILRAAREHTRDAERRVVTEVRQAVADLRASRDKLETSELQVQQAETAVSLAETRYRAGVITNLEVLDAQTALAQARLLRLRAQYAIVRSRYELERAVGARPW